MPRVRLPLAVTAAVIACVGGTAAQGNFVAAPGSPYSVGNEPYSVNPGNFTGDALTDLAVVNGTSSTVDVFNQLANDGGFGLAAGSPFNVGSGPNFAAVADFNGDGRQDLAVSNYTSGSISVMLRQPDDTFVAEGPAISVGDNPGAIATGNLDGTGGPDLAVAGFNNHTVKIFLRNGTNNGFVAGGTVSTGGTNPRYMAAGDLDGTGGPDLAVTNSGSDNVAVLLNQGGGNFAAAAGSPFGVGDVPQFVVIAPLDSDTLPDIAVANYNSANVTVLDRQPGGGFVPESGSPYAVGNNPVGLAAADFDGSGHQDLVAADGGSASFTILKNTGTTFTREADIPVVAGGSPYGIATGLFNSSDSLPDVAVTSLVNTPNTLSVFLNRPLPQATTLDATAVDSGSATLNATVNPAGLDTDAHFEYGTTTAYGTQAPAGGELPVGSDRADHAVGRAVTGLAPSTTYHFRVIASSAGGTTAGADKTFTTPAVPPAPAHDGTPKPPSSTGSGPPQAYLRAPATIAAGTPTTLSAEGSTPAGALSYKLDLDGSGNYATDLKTATNLQTTFTTPGDIKVGLRVTDALGRTDTVRRTVHVTAPPVYGFSYTPDSPDVGQKVHFTLRQLFPDPTKPGATVSRDMPDGTTATMTYGDDTPTSATVSGILYRGRAASADGDFTHTYTKADDYTVHISVEDGNGYSRSLDAVIPVGKAVTYQPAIATDATTVEQGSCVSFSNSTATELARQDTGPNVDIDINPVHQIIQIKPDITQLTAFGGEQGFLTQPVDFNFVKSNVFTAGSVFAQFALPNLNVAALGVSGFGGRSKTRQVEPTQTTTGTDACNRWQDIENATANAVAQKQPYPAGADKGWPAIQTPCTGGQKVLTYAENPVSFNGTTKTVNYTRFGWFSVNQWDFGDGTKSGKEGYLPSYQEFHPYDKPGNYTVNLTTTFPRDLKHQLDDWNSDCTSRPLNALNPDGRFATRSTQLKLHVKAHFDRIKMRGLWMTSGAHFFDETDLPGVYDSTGPIYVNTRRNGPTTNGRGDIDFSDDVADADGILIVTPDNGPLKVVPDQGEIIGAAHLAWQSNGQQLALGPMPTTISGTPGLIIPPAAAGGTHDLGFFNDPPASLVSKPTPDRGTAFHINSAHVILREGGPNGGGGGGTIELNIHLPAPLGTNGEGGDQTVSRTFSGVGRAVSRASILDNFDIDLPAVELVPDVLDFGGGTLSHHVGADPPWNATGSLTVFHYKVDMNSDANRRGCPIRGGLGFDDDGGLAYAGAAVTGLQIPIPNPPLPNPVSALADPALYVSPGTAHKPLDLFGCLTYTDYPDGDAFQIVGCAGFLLAGGGKSIAPGTNLPFCPDQKGNGSYALNDHNTTPDPANAGYRVMKGVIVRVSGDVGVGPDHFSMAKAYVEFRSIPFAIETQADFSKDFLDGAITLDAQLFGYYRGSDDWGFGGEAGVKQKIICVPFTDLCPDSTMALLASNIGIGGCVTILGFPIGASLEWKGPKPHVYVPCHMSDLHHDLGGNIRRLPTYGDFFARPGDPIAATSAAQTGSIDLDASPYAAIIVGGTGSSPVVEVRDPQGKLVLDDNGQPVQGLTTDSDPLTAQGIIHNDLAQFHDTNVDMRHTTLILLHQPQKGTYTITAKAGSSPITGISHADAFPTPVVHGGVAGSGVDRLLTLQATLPAGTTMWVTEEGLNFSNRIAVLSAPKAGSRRATIARVSRHVRFKPELAPTRKRRLVATIMRDGIPVQQIKLGTYTGPKPPKAGKVHGLRTKLRGSKLTISWKPAKNAQHYEVHLALRRGLSIDRSIRGKSHKLVIREPLARLGATVTVRAISPLEDAGRAARHRIKAAKVKRIKHFVL